MEEPTILSSAEMPGSATGRRTLRWWVFLGEHGLRSYLGRSPYVPERRVVHDRALERGTRVKEALAEIEHRLEPLHLPGIIKGVPNAHI
jgi:hypothetical protein